MYFDRYYVRGSVGSGVTRVLVNTAGSLALGRGELDVAAVAPAGTPRVADEHVLLAVLGAVADGGNAVVEIGAALRAAEHTALVVLEDGLVSLDSHRDDGLLDRGNELGRQVRHHLIKAGGLDGTAL